MICHLCHRELSIQKELDMHLKYFHGHTSNNEGTSSQATIDRCPDCGSQLAMLEGCKSCLGCGFSKCS